MEDQTVCRKLIVCLLLIHLAGITLTAFCQAQDEKPAPILRIESGGHTETCHWIGFTPDGRQLVSAGNDKVIRVWDMTPVIEASEQPGSEKSDTVLQKIPLLRSHRLQIGPGKEGRIYAAAISPNRLSNGSWLLAVGGHGTSGSNSKIGDIKLVDLSNGTVLRTLSGHNKSVHDLAFSPSGDFLASAGADHSVRVWDVNFTYGLNVIDETQEIPCQILNGHKSYVTSLAFIRSDGHSLRLASSSFDKTIHIWNQLKNRQWKFEKVLNNHTDTVYRLAVSPNGEFLASSSNDNTVRVWDVEEGTEIKKFKSTTGDTYAKITFTQNGKALISSANRHYGGTHVWSIPDGNEIANFEEHDNVVVRNTFSQSSDTRPLYASTGGDRNEIHIWDVLSDKIVGRIVGKGRPVFGVAFSQDSRWIRWSNVNRRNLAPLKHCFDLSEIRLGEPANSDITWHRTNEKYSNWSAEFPDDERKTLVVRKGKDESCRLNANSEIRHYGFLPTGGIMISAGSTLGLFDPNTGKLLRKFEGHSSTIQEFSISVDGRLLVSGAFDQTIKLWNVATGEELLSIFASYSDEDETVAEWMAWTPAGYYKASPGGNELIGWHLNQGADKAAEFVAAWQMRKLFEKPGILEFIPSTLSVTGAIEEFYASPAVGREKPMSVAKDLEEMRPPSVTIYRPSSFQTVRTETVELRAKFRPSGRQPIQEVRLLVNGRPPPDFENPVSATESIEEVDLEFDVPLEPGNNIIELLASTRSATSAVERVDVVRETQTKSADPANPNCYILGIGIAEYKLEELNTLKFPADDVLELIAAWKKQKGSIFAKVEDKPVINKDATSIGIKRGLSWLKESVTQIDLAVVLVSAHGWPEGSNGYYIQPHEFDPSEPDVTGFSKNELLERLRNLPCKVLLILDTCHSGRAAKSELRFKNSRDAIDRIVSDFTSIESGIVVLASSSKDELSMEKDEWGHGAFTKAILEAFNGESKEDDGILNVDELGTFVTNRVKALTGGKQHVIKDLGRITPFPVAVFENATVSDRSISGMVPKGVRAETLTLPIGDVRKDLKDSKFYLDVLTRHYGDEATIRQTVPGALEFSIVGEKPGIVTNEANRWERWTLNFVPEKDQVNQFVRSFGWLEHVKTPNKPSSTAYQMRMSATHRKALEDEINEILIGLKNSAVESP